MKLNIGWDKNHTYWVYEKSPQSRYNDFYNGNNPKDINSELINNVNQD